MQISFVRNVSQLVEHRARSNQRRRTKPLARAPIQSKQIPTRLTPDTTTNTANMRKITNSSTQATATYHWHDIHFRK